MKYCPHCKEALTARVIDAVERLACPSPACGFVHWNNPTPVVAALVRLGDEYLLARNAEWPPGLFSLLTGFLEKGEAPELAVLREVREEVGLVGTAQFLGHFALPELNQLIIAFAVDASGEICLSGEIAEIQYLSADELARRDFGRMRVTTEIVARNFVMRQRAVDRPLAAVPAEFMKTCLDTQGRSGPDA